MDENPGLSDQYRTASPWPIFVAFGFVIAEVGVLFGFFSIAVGGILLFCGSLSGLVHEAGYASTPWRTLAALSVLFLVIGGALATTEVAAMRGYAIVAAALILLVGSVVGELLVTDGPTPV
ncbi:cox cluster protein [Halobium palmae]|uniref:Cox cluster protein n=1 Tax=Halobium palmae TaxID=1776492 RepID=A0ABD5RZ74_9EURY